MLYRIYSVSVTAYYFLSHDALFPCGNSCHCERCITYLANFVYYALYCY